MAAVSIATFLPRSTAAARGPFREPLHLTENRLEFDLDQDAGLRSAQKCKKVIAFIGASDRS